MSSNQDAAYLAWLVGVVLTVAGIGSSLYVGSIVRLLSTTIAIVLWGFNQLNGGVL